MQKRERGITLIALVITIIILLILAGVSIATLTDSGLFDKAKNAEKKYEEAEIKENETLQGYESIIDEYISGTAVETLASKVKVGDYVSYTPDTANTDSILEELGTYSGSTENTSSTLTQESLNWRVLDVVDGKVRLISAKPTDSKITLYGYNGYNNAVYLIDKVCGTLYNNSTYADKVQSLKIEDIQKYMTTTDYSTITSSYGSKFSPQTNFYPTILGQEAEQIVNGTTGTLGLSEQNGPINQTTTNQATSWTVKYTYWRKTMVDTDFTNSIYYDLFINDGTNNYSPYWMSSRCVFALFYGADFRVRVVSSGGVGAYALYNSNGVSDGSAYALRPVITLNSNVLVKSGDGTSADTAYEIGV